MERSCRKKSLEKLPQDRETQNVHRLATLGQCMMDSPYSNHQGDGGGKHNHG